MIFPTRHFFVVVATLYLTTYLVCCFQYPKGGRWKKSTLISESREPVQVEIEFIPSKITVKTTVGKNLIDLGRSVGLKLPFSCRKGECKKCEVVFEGKTVLACKSLNSWTAIPSSKNWNIVTEGYKCVGYEKEGGGGNKVARKITVVVPPPPSK